MTCRILIAASQADVREDIRDSVLESWQRLKAGSVDGVPDDPPLFVEARTLEDARQYLAADGPQFELVVTTLQIPESRSSQRDDEEERGLELARHCAHADDIKASVIVDMRYGARHTPLPVLLAEMPRLQNVSLLIAEQSPEETIANVLQLQWAGLQPAAQDSPPVRRDVVVEIDLARQESKYAIVADGVLKIQGDLLVSQKKLDRLGTWSRTLGKLGEDSDPEDDWLDDMRGIGEELYDEILSKNASFMGHLQQIAMGEPDTVHYRFRLDWKKYRIFFEAMVPRNEERDDDPRDFWMLKTPLSRRLALPGGTSMGSANEPFVLCLPKDRREPLNCLIIESDVHSEEAFSARFYRDPPKPLPSRFPPMPRLRNVRMESAWLEMELEKLRAGNSGSAIGKVVKIDPRSARELDPDATSFCEVLSDHFGKERWHIVHFAGHSWYEEGFDHPNTDRKGRGWLFFPALREGDPIEAITAEHFAALWCHRPEFVYLSSCHSSRDDVVFELGRNEIKAIVGFRWNVDDDRAFEYARAFYSGLLTEGDRLEQAFLKARREAFEQNLTNKAWAAATLVLEA